MTSDATNLAPADASDAAEEEGTPGPRQHAALRQQGVSPELVSQQVLMQHTGQESNPEAAASAGRTDVAADDAALVRPYHCS